MNAAGRAAFHLMHMGDMLISSSDGGREIDSIPSEDIRKHFPVPLARHGSTGI